MKLWWAGVGQNTHTHRFVVVKGGWRGKGRHQGIPRQSAESFLMYIVTSYLSHENFVWQITNGLLKFLSFTLRPLKHGIRAHYTFPNFEIWCNWAITKRKPTVLTGWFSEDRGTGAIVGNQQGGSGSHFLKMNDQRGRKLTLSKARQMVKCAGHLGSHDSTRLGF